MHKPVNDKSNRGGANRPVLTGRAHSLAAAFLLPALLLLPASALRAQNPPAAPQQPIPASQPSSTAQPIPAAQPVPDAPQPQAPATPAPPPCKSAASTAKPATAPGPATPATPPAQQPPCTPPPPTNWFARFLNGPEVKPLTPAEKARLAVRNLLDPFNAITILGQSGIAIASDAHSPYGPGMPGFARNVGVSYTEDLTGEFFGTFLIPSLVRQDPHYHRMPRASIPRRFAHTLLQIAWTQGDNGKGMLNYSTLLGSAIDGEISNLYVPGQQTNAPATASRYAIGLATAPVDNLITEFLPDVARRIHVRIVLVQRVINQVAKTEGGATP